MVRWPNKAIGLAPGPFITGLIADRFDLLVALKFLPLPCLLSALAMALVRATYARQMAARAGADAR